MNKIFFIVMFSFSILNAEKLIKASVAHQMTKQETNKIKKELMNSKKGKKAHKSLIRLFNKKISKIASKGYYNSYIITYINTPDEIENSLRPLSKVEQNIMRSIIIRELQSKGYKVQYNKFWDNPDSFNITIIW